LQFSIMAVSGTVEIFQWFAHCPLRYYFQIKNSEIIPFDSSRFAHRRKRWQPQNMAEIASDFPVRRE